MTHWIIQGHILIPTSEKNLLLEFSQFKLTLKRVQKYSIKVIQLAEIIILNKFSIKEKRKHPWRSHWIIQGHVFIHVFKKNILLQI